MSLKKMQLGDDWPIGHDTVTAGVVGSWLLSKGKAGLYAPSSNTFIHAMIPTGPFFVLVKRSIMSMILTHFKRKH